jgi:hypothetical protein
MLQIMLAVLGHKDLLELRAGVRELELIQGVAVEVGVEEASV